MKYFVANWKANKNESEANVWLDTFTQNLKNKDAKVIICPPHPFLISLKKNLQPTSYNLQAISLGVQNISVFDNGAYTGEVTAQLLKGLATYTIIGHSERRSNFGETDMDVAKKAYQAKKYGIEPILCVRDEKDKIPEGVKIVAYEPVYAIGTGQNEAPEAVLELKQKLSLPSDNIFLYGGSVDETNANEYLATGQIDGFLVGGSSLDPVKFAKIVNLA